ncbi:peptide deformylase [endosymbiont of Ridgeia piscesae]|uniref:Peptide deformylase n=1 Tax=endosymbiont of Ridgeia piscesae TaxID=54398 RepID=A0A0T5Z1Z3_9GAMM|nr:peptide deformylase [endosymbiont of Ridgeia piscesae]
MGIAAPQVSDFRRVIIIDCSQTRKPVPNHGRLVLVNPEISKWDGFELGREGCLSVPDYTGNVIRAERIKLTAQDPYGEPLEFDMEGYEARALQHEVDHLDGILFVDRLVSRRTDLFQRKVYQKGGKKKQGK